MSILCSFMTKMSQKGPKIGHPSNPTKKWVLCHTIILLHCDTDRIT